MSPHTRSTPAPSNVISLADARKAREVSLPGCAPRMIFTGGAHPDYPESEHRFANIVRDVWELTPDRQNALTYAVAALKQVDPKQLAGLIATMTAQWADVPAVAAK